MIFFNISNFLTSISVILYLQPFFRVEENLIELEFPSQSESNYGEILIGRVLKGKSKKYKFFLSLKDLERHMFICGATGTGKSNFLQNFLINFNKIYNFPFLLVEFKGEYHFLQKKINDIIILWPGENFSINIFNPGSSNPIIHAERIFDILKSAQFLDENSEYSPQMEKVLIEILIKVCKSKKLQNWGGFEYFCKEYLEKNKKTIPMLNQTLIAVKNRIRRFSTGPLNSIFEGPNQIDINEIFKKKILLDLSSIIRLGGEKEDALFFLNMILKYLWDRNLSDGTSNFKGIKHITIIEDAQYFAPQNLMRKNKLTSYLEDIALLLRGTGECLITLATRPDISKEILANNAIVLTFKNHIEKEIMCELLNMDIEKKQYLSMLEEGQCIIRINSIKDPFLLKVPLVKRDQILISEIIQKNKLNLDKNKNHATSIPLIYQKSCLNKLRNLNYNKFLKKIIDRVKQSITKIFSKEESLQNNPSFEFEDLKTNNKLDSFNELKLYVDELYNQQKKKDKY